MFGLQGICYDLGELTGGRKTTMNHKALTAFIYLPFEDIPQFVVQVINTLYLGRTMSWLQVISPIISGYSLFDRVPGEMHNVTHPLANCLLCMNFTTLLGVYIVILIAHSNYVACAEEICGNIILD